MQPGLQTTALSMVQAEQRLVKRSFCGESETITKELGRKIYCDLGCLDQGHCKKKSAFMELLQILDALLHARMPFHSWQVFLLFLQVRRGVRLVVGTQVHSGEART